MHRSPSRSPRLPALLVAVWAALASVTVGQSEGEDALRAWLDTRSASDQYGRFANYRSMVFGQKPPAPLADLENGMRTFHKPSVALLADPAIEALLAFVKDEREGFASLSPYLPWLLLVEKARPDDTRVTVLLVEAWAAPGQAFDPDAARALCKTVLALPERRRASLASFLPELSSLGSDDESGSSSWLAERLESVDARLEQGQSIEPAWLIRQRLMGLDEAFATAVRNDGDVLDVVAAMQKASPRDPSHSLLFVLVAGSSGRDAPPSAVGRARRSFLDEWGRLASKGARRKEAVRARLDRLGIFVACKQLGVDESDPLVLLKVGRNLEALFPTHDEIERKRALAKKFLQGTRDRLNAYKADKSVCEARRKFWADKERSARTESASRDAKGRIRDCDSQLDELTKNIKRKTNEIRGREAEIARYEGTLERLRGFSIDGASDRAEHDKKQSRPTDPR